MSVKGKLSIRDIAKEANVSIATVSNVIHKNGKYSKETEELVNSIIEKSGYVSNNVARSLKSSSSHMIAVIIPNISNDFFCTITMRIEQSFTQRGYSTLICNTGNNPEKEKEYFRTLRGMMVDGIICISCQMHFDRSLVSPDTPLVFVDRNFSDDNEYTYILSDTYKGMYDATSILIQKGCRNILFVSRDNNTRIDVNSQNNAGRLLGYQAAMQKSGLKCDEYNLLRIPVQEESIEACDKFIQEYLKQNEKPDGIVTCSDNEAIGIIRGLKKAGLRVPEDVLVFGFDNTFRSEIFSPSISTVGRFNEKIGHIAAEELYEQIHDPSYRKPKNIILPVQVIERESTQIK